MAPAPTDHDLYNELAAYTLELRDPEFLHQHFVDVYAVQHAGSKSKPISTVFGLMGLYLHLEHNFTGRQVQLAHMQMARRHKQWTAPPYPADFQASLRIADILDAPPGSARNALIERWCAEVWNDWQHARTEIAVLARDLLGVEDHVR